MERSSSAPPSTWIFESVSSQAASASLRVASKSKSGIYALDVLAGLLYAREGDPNPRLHHRLRLVVEVEGDISADGLVLSALGRGFLPELLAGPRARPVERPVELRVEVQGVGTGGPPAPEARAALDAVGLYDAHLRARRALHKADRGRHRPVVHLDNGGGVEDHVRLASVGARRGEGVAVQSAEARRRELDPDPTVFERYRVVAGGRFFFALLVPLFFYRKLPDQRRHAEVAVLAPPAG
ncbi:MAG: hypothetical protein M3426_16415, partial [Actinomycetota bacterium]|nr:hypothetical protein [Actinomycetota bacterium]